MDLQANLDNLLSELNKSEINEIRNIFMMNHYEADNHDYHEENSFMDEMFFWLWFLIFEIVVFITRV